MQSLIDSRTARVIFTILLYAVALGFLYVARRTLLVFLFAIFFAYLVDPAIARLEKLFHSRGRAIGVVYLFLVALLITFFFFVGPHIAHQAQRLSETLPSVVDKVGSGQIAEQLGAEHGWNLETRQQLKRYLINHKSDLAVLAQHVGLRAAEAAKESWLLILVPILAIFFLKDGRVFNQVLLSFVGTRPQREFVEGVLGDLNQMLAHFIRAQLILAGLSMITYSSFMGLMRVPYAMVLGVVGGMMEFVPVVGPFVAGVMIMVVAVLVGYPHVLLLLFFLLAWRMVQDYVVSPRILGRSMELHPLAAIFGVLAGGEIAGVLGVYLSIPIMASLRIVWRRWRLYAEKRRFGPLTDYTFGSELAHRE